MQSKFVGVLCIAVLCIILTLGLWPFHSPPNDVTWLRSTNGLSFGRYGTVQSSGALGAPHGVSGSIELWVQPARWSGSTILAFYEPESRRRFELQQSVADLKLEVAVQNKARTTRTRLYVGAAFAHPLQRKTPIFITVTYGPDGTKIYLDGTLAEAAPHFEIPREAFSGRIIVGDSPWQSDSFEGQIRGLAIYDAELDRIEILRHYLTWTKNGRPDITENARNIALYLFDEKTGSVIHDRAAAGVDLHIPETYAVVDKIALEPLWKEFSFSRSYWKNNLINVVGFLPVGFVFYAYFRVARPIRKAMLATLAVGAATSLTIEVLQAFLPTRDSGTSDLITNTFGTYLGVLCFRDIYPTLTKTFPWLSWFLAPHGDKVNEVLPEKNWKTLPRCPS
jgi:VanZ family protein